MSQNDENTEDPASEKELEANHLPESKSLLEPEAALQNGDAHKDASDDKTDCLTEATEPQEVKNRFGCNILHLYIVNYSFLMIFYMGQNVYNIGVIRTLERKFGLSSTQSGMIMAMNDISHILVVIFVGYFGKKAHKPRMLSLSLVLVGIAGFIMSSPQFFFNDSTPHEDLPALVSQSPTAATPWPTNSTREVFEELALCQADKEEHSCNAYEIKRDSTNNAAYYTFMAAQFISGLGGSSMHTLGYTYVDENAPKHKSALYIGILGSVFSVGTATGLGLASLCLRLPEHLGTEPLNSPGDATWIGAWWLGYVIQASCILLFCIPMCFFPKHIIKQKTPSKRLEPEEPVSLKQQLKEFPKSMLELFKNATYMVFVLKSVLLMFVLSGIFVNMPRYIEVHFMQPAHKSSFVGVSGVVAGLIGSLSGGYVMKRFKVRALGAAKMVAFSMACAMLGILTAMMLGCPKLDVAGQWQDDGMLSVSTPCNSNCSCSVNRMAYKPVCGDDGLTYFSPCHAGCTQQDGEEFSDCQCIPEPESGGYGGVSLGKCDVDCQLLIPYIIALFFMSMLASVGRAPSTILQFRIVGDEQRAFALGVTSFAINLLGFIPSPILYGTLIDSACVLWQTTCSGTGNCLLYDSKVFRLVTHGTALLFQVLALISAVAVCVLVSKNTFPGDETKEKAADTVTVEMEEKKPLNNVETIEEKT